MISLCVIVDRTKLTGCSKGRVFRAPPKLVCGARHATLEAGEGKTGHIKTDTDEGILFFDSQYWPSQSPTRQILMQHRRVSTSITVATSATLANGTAIIGTRQEGQ